MSNIKRKHERLGAAIYKSGLSIPMVACRLLSFSKIACLGFAQVGYAVIVSADFCHRVFHSNEHFPHQNIGLQKLLRLPALLVLMAILVNVEIVSAQVVAGTAVSGTLNNASSTTISYTNTSGSNKLLVVGVSAQQPYGYVTSITYNGTQLTKLGNLSNSNQGRIEGWYLVNPPVGTFNVVVNNSQGDNAVIGVMSFSNVNQTTPFGTVVSAQGSGTTATVIANSAINDLVFGVVAFNNGSTNLTPGSGQTEYWDKTVNSSIAGAGSMKPGAASVTMSWTSTSASWTIGAVSIKANTSPTTAPGGVGGAALWLKANDGATTGTTFTWTDRSGNSRNAVQSTAGNQPTLANSGFNYNPTISFDGSNDYLAIQNLAGLPTGAAQVQQFAVANHLNTPGNWSHIMSYGSGNTNQMFGLGKHTGTANTTLMLYTNDAISSTSEFQGGRPVLMDGKYTGTQAVISSFGVQRATITATANKTIAAGYVGVDPVLATATYWNGRIPEIILFPTNLTATQTSQVNSYLAIKYGITLDQTSPQNYIASNGTTVYWNGATNSGYGANIAGIARDDASALEQKQSRSVNEGFQVAMGNANTIAATNADNTTVFSADRSALLWGNNTGAVAWTFTGAPANRQVLARKWKVQETGTVGSVKVQVADNGGTDGLPAEETIVYLLTDADGDFSSGATETAMTLNGTNWEVNFDFANGQFFTFATHLPFAPGGVFTNLDMWFKADKDATPSQWNDQKSALHQTQPTSANQPVLTTNAVNFNPAFTFDGVNDFFSNTNLPLQPNSEDYYAVVKPNALAGDHNMLGFGFSGNSNNVKEFRFSGNRLQFGTLASSWQNIISSSTTSGTWQIADLNRLSGTTYLRMNGAQVATGTITQAPTTINHLNIGARRISGANDQFFNGQIPEVIVFSAPLSATDRLKVQSYLAIKYGITLAQATAQNYIASNGSIFWNATTNTGFNANIAGIARDDASSLNQKQSKSVNPGLQVAMGNGNTIAATNAANANNFSVDKAALMWGDNAGSNTAWTALGAPAGREILPRKWRVQETGSVGSVKVQVRDGNLSNLASQMTTGPNNLEIKTGLSQGQTFSYTSGSGSYQVNQIQLNLRKDADATGQLVTFRIRSTWGGADLATVTLSSNDLTTSYAWYNFALPSAITLTDGATYFLRADNSGAGKIWWNQASAGNYAGGAALTTAGAPDGSKDNLFRVQYTTPDGLPDEGGNAVYLLVDANGNFTTGAIEIPMTLNGNFWGANMDMADGQYFTFAKGCVLVATGAVTPAGPCFGASVGSIVLSHGGTSPFTYNWAASGGGAIPVGQSTIKDLTGLVAGTYHVTVTDNTGCQAFSNFTVTQPDLLGLTVTSTQEFPAGGMNGTISLTAIGGTAPFTYDWADVAGTNNPKDRSALTAGTYTVTVTDSKGCTATAAEVIATLNFVYKQLYLSDPSQVLDRIDPVATGDATTSNTTLASVTANPVVTAVATSSGSSVSVLSGGTLTFSHTPGTSANRILLVSVAVGNTSPSDEAAPGTVTSVRFGGVLMTQVASVVSTGGVRCYIYQLINPSASPSANVVVTIGSKTSSVTASATTFSGVNQSSPLGIPQTYTATGTFISGNYASTTGEVVYSLAAADEYPQVPQSISPAAGQAQLWNASDFNYVSAASSTKPGASSVSLRYNFADPEDACMAAVAIKPAPVAVNNTTFTQAPAFCSPLTIIKGQPITITSYVTVISGTMPANPAINATLKYGLNNIISLASPTYNSGTGLLTWTGTLANDATVPAGQGIDLVITTTQNGVTFNIDYDSQTKPSKVALPVTTYIDIVEYAVYSAPYPGGSVITGAGAGTTVYPRAVVTDPFGHYDITGLNITVSPPGTTVAATTVDAEGCLKTYEYAWSTTGLNGAYSINATAKEGFENTVTDVQPLSFSICSPAIGTPVFSLGGSSTWCQGAGSVTYSATSTGATSMVYTLDAASLAAGNNINAATGKVTYIAGWVGTSIITAQAFGCAGPKSATHTVTMTPSVTVPVFNLGGFTERCKGAGAVTYSATATNATGITYSLDATSLAAGNTINPTTGIVNYAAGWRGNSTITASAAGCNGPALAYHVATSIGVVAIEDAATGIQGNPLSINVLDNDLCDKNPNSVTIVSEPTNGFLQVGAGGGITYLPNGSFFGADEFTYQVCSNGPSVQCDQAVVKIQIEEALGDPCAEASRSKTFYLSFPENTTQMRKAFWSASSVNFVSNNVRTILSIKAIYPGTIITYDHWEDGYETNITLPSQSTTEIWGDGNPSNGWAPGYANDIIPAGGYIIVDNQFQYNPRVSSTIAFDGKDKLFSSNDIALSKITGDAGFGGGSPTFAVQNVKTNVVDISRYGKLFVLPFGENLTLGGTAAFKYTALFVKAATNGTVVTLDYDGNGTVDVTSPTLNEGEVWFYDGTASTFGVSSDINRANDLKAGAVVTSNHPVGVDLMFGGIDSYGTRNLALLPGLFYGSTYYCPVYTTLASAPVYAFFTNSLNTPIAVNWRAGTGANGTVTIPANGATYLSLSEPAGYKFESQIGESFTAVAVIDADNDGSAYDWSFNMIPENRLSTFSSIAWAPGSNDLSGNYNPIWVTAPNATTIYIKYDGDLTNSSGMISPCGIPYDVAVPLGALNVHRIFDVDNDQTGTAIYTCDGTNICAVWGQDPNAGNPTPPGSPAQDVGYVMAPKCLSQLIIANDDVETTEPSTPVIVNIMRNDAGFLCTPNPASISNIGLLQPTNGTVVINADGTITYTPNPGFQGTDKFEYRLCAIEYPDICDNALVTIYVTDCFAFANENLIVGKVFVEQLPDNGAFNNEAGAAGVQVNLYNDINCNGVVNGTENIAASTLSDINGNYSFSTNRGYNAKDDFDPTAALNGNDGGVNWSNSWSEVGDDGNINTGNVRIIANTGFGNLGNAIRLSGPSKGINRTLSFSGATGAMLRFSFKRQGLNVQGEGVNVQLNGSTIYAINDGSYVGSDINYQNVVIPLSSYNANGSNTLQFITNGVTATDDFFWIDNVELTYFVGTSCYIVKVDPTNLGGAYGTSILNTQTASFNGLGVCNKNNFLGVLVKVDAINDMAVVGQDVATQINILNNDIVRFPNLADIAITSPPTNGAVTVNPDGTTTYTPNTGFTGTDQYNYQVCSLEDPGVCDIATVFITVSCSITPGVNAVSGMVYYDQNLNGAFNTNETGAAGVGVRLYQDTNGNGAVDAGEPLLQTKTSNAQGAYSFDIAVPIVGNTVLDQFNTNGVGTGNNGTANWSAAWAESGENNGFASGSVIVTGNRLRMSSGTRGAIRTANLTGAVTAQFSFNFEKAGLDDSNDNILIQVSTSATGPWTTLETLTFPNGSGTRSYDIAGFIASATSVRFLTSSTLGSTDYFYFDNVQIAYNTYSTATRHFVLNLSTPLPSGFTQSSTPTNQAISFNVAGDSRCGRSFGLRGADLSIVKTGTPNPVMAGQNITYTIVVTNNGPTNAENVVVSDILPAGLTLVSATPSIGTWTTPNWNVGILARGVSRTLVIVATASTTLMPGTVVSNTATVTSTTPDPVLANNTSTATTTIVCQSISVVVGSNSPTCEGSSLTINASAPTAVSWNWTGPNGFSSNAQNPVINAVTPAASGQYSVTATAANGCTGTGTHTVNIRNAPAAGAGVGSDLCTGFSTTIQAIGGTTYSWSNGANTSVITVSPLTSTTYFVTVTNANGCTATASHVLTVAPCHELCDNGVDDDNDGFVDCEDVYCNRITLATPVVSECINQPLQDVATVSIEVSWINAPDNDQIEVSILGQTERINTGNGATSPQTVVFTVPANGALNRTVTASWMGATSLCSATATFNTPNACSNDQTNCNILYLCGLDKPFDGDSWDHGFINYLDEVNGSNFVMPVLTKADATGMGTYDVNNQTLPINIILSNYELVVISATTEGHIAPALVAALKNFGGAVLNSNYEIIDDLGFSTTAGSYQFQNNLYVDNSLSKEIYNFNNDINPSYTKVFTRGNYTSAADAYLWTNSGEQALGINGVYFVYSSADPMPGVAAGHGRRVYLGYHMNGFYANAQNGGVLPAPASSYFVPATHLTLEGKYFFDLAILDATKGCNIEICDNGVDDNDNGLVDCQEVVCVPPSITNVAMTTANNCPALNNAQITISAVGANLSYSINGGSTYQASNVFTGVAVGTYHVQVRNSVTGCIVNFANNPVQIIGITCYENCANGIDDDGDGLADCLDPDCQPIVNAGADASICIGSSYTLVASAAGGVGPYSFSWSNGLGNGQSKTVTPMATTTYQVTVSSTGGCSATDAVTVTITTCSEVCTDGVDNDGDGLIDCDDEDCVLVATPHLQDDVYQTCPGIVFQEQPIFNDHNLQNPVYSIYSNPTKGTVTMNYQGVFTYTPTAVTCGTDSFRYQVCNAASGCCSQATVVLHLGDNAPPTLQNLPADITIDCSEPIPSAPVVLGLDNCPGIYVSFDEVNNKPNAGTCQNYSIVRTWTSADQCGNTATGTQTLHVVDTEAPEIFRVYTLTNGKKLVAGLTPNGTTNWRNISFPISFGETPVVFSQVVSNNSPEAIVTRHRNIGLEGFELRIQEEENGDGIHANEQVAWMAMEPGNLADISNLQAGLISNVTNVEKTVFFTSAFTTVPTIIASPQTFAESDPIQVRFKAQGIGSFKLFLEEERSKDLELVHANESVAFLAAKPGNITDNKGDFVALTGTVNLTHNWVTVNLGRKFTKPVVLFGGQVAANDPATIRVRNVTPTSFQVRIQEWDYLNGVVPQRTVSYFVVEGSVPALNPEGCSGRPLPLLAGFNILSVDNCDNQAVVSLTENSDLSASGLVMNRVWTSADNCGNTTSLVQYDTCNIAAVRLRANLNGAMLGVPNGTSLMRDNLLTKGLIPTNNPYNFGAFSNNGQPPLALLPSLLEVTGDNAIVDWVLVQIRDADQPSIVLRNIPCLLQRDGDVVSRLGTDVIVIDGMPEDYYHVYIKHRNHLGLMTANPVYLKIVDPHLVDFTIPGAHVYQFGTAGRISNGRLMLWPGDLNNDSKVIYQGPLNDAFQLFSEVMTAPGNTDNLANFIMSGYVSTDLNLDGFAIFQGPTNDKSMLLLNTILAHPVNTSLLANFIAVAALP